MDRNGLIELIREKESFLCVGLDSDPKKIPAFLHAFDDPVFEFNRRIIDATLPYAVAYKPNFAFYESQGLRGWQSLGRTMAYLHSLPSPVFTIADAKRGDIGNTSTQYALAVFDGQAGGLGFDAITVAPYMGKDSIEPFLAFKGKWAIVLALTSNPGADDFQLHLTAGGQPLYKEVLSKTSSWGSPENMMFVTGATRAEALLDIRKIIPDHFLLVPGVGAQGGSLAEVAKYGMNADCGLLVNASRSILFASQGEDFSLKAAQEAEAMQKEMKGELKKAGFPL